MFLCDSLSHIVLRGRWCNIIDIPSEKKSVDSKEIFYVELEQVFDHFPKYNMKILLGDFNEKAGRENIFKRQLAMRVYVRVVMIMVLE